MATPEGYIREIKSLDDTIKRLNAHIRSLREKRTAAQTHLFNWMARRKLEEYKGYKKDKLAPKPKVIRKKEAEKRDDAMRLFQEIGVNDPGDLWETLKTIQRPKKVDDE